MPILKISEHTDRPELIDFLKRNLGIQFRVFQELILEKRQQEDIVIFQTEKIEIEREKNEIIWNDSDSVSAVIETKIKGITNLEEGENQLRGYCKEFNTKIGFLTNYEDLIYYEYTFDYQIYISEVHRFDSLDKISDLIAKKIENYTGIGLVKNPEEIISDLEKCIEILMRYTQKISGEEWEKLLRLSDEPEKSAKKKELTKQELEERNIFFQRTAAYIAITQLLFYIVFRMYRIENNLISPKLPPLSSSNGVPTQIQEILEFIPKSNLNFASIFGKNREIFSRLDDKAATILLKIIYDLEGISNKFVIENNLIGQIFQRLLPFETRKRFAAYYTRNQAAEFLCQLAIDDKDAKVYDPACGSGTLLVKAYYRKKQLGLTQHKQLLNDIKGSDISDIAAMMSTVNLAIQDPSKWINEVNIYPHDAFSLISGLERFFPHEKITGDGKKIVESAYQELANEIDVLIGNPPFTRGMRLSEKYRKFLSNLNVVKKYNFSPNFSAIGLHAFFLLIATQLVNKKNGRIAFILPYGAINSVAMIDVWNIMFKEKFGIKFIIIASAQDEAFSDSEGHEIMIILERNYIDIVKFIKIIDSLRTKDIKILVQNLNEIKNPSGKVRDFQYKIVDQSFVRNHPCTEWFLETSIFLQLFYSNFIPLNKEKLSSNEKVKYEIDLKNEITGIGRNRASPTDYWLIPNKYWEIKEINQNNIILKATSKNTIISQNSTAKQIIKLPRDAFVIALERSMSNYRQYPPILPENANHLYFLINEKREDVKEYYRWGQKAHKENLFAKEHTSYSISKNQIGIPQKIDFTTSKTLALRFSEPAMGAGAIMFGFSSDDDEIMDLFFAYLTSSLFLLDALYKSRSRRAEFVRIHQIDFYTIYRFPNLMAIKNNQKIKESIIKCSKKYNLGISLQKRPRFAENIKDTRINPNNFLRELDEAWFKALNLDIKMIDQFYQEIEDVLSKFSEKKNIEIE